MLDILYWNVRRIRLAHINDDHIRNLMIPLIGKADIAFIIENMSSTNELVNRITFFMSQVYNGANVFYQHMGGYSGTDEKMIIVDKKGLITRSYAINDQGRMCNGTGTSAIRFPVVVEVNSGYKFAGVHLPGPRSGYSHTTIYSKIIGQMIRHNINIVGGDWNMPPRPAYRFRRGRIRSFYHIGPFNTAGKASRTTFNDAGDRRNAYDWALRQNGIRAQARVITNWGRDNATRWQITDHLPVMVQIGRR